jgi:hypothetical protein
MVRAGLLLYPPGHACLFGIVSHRYPPRYRVNVHDVGSGSAARIDAGVVPQRPDTTQEETR